MPTPAPYALFPLSPFDQVFERTTFITGWLVEGTIDIVPLEAALQKVTDKWRMLAGRVHSQRAAQETKWFVKIPLGILSADYKRYALSTLTSEVPLSSHVSLPLARSSSSLPLPVFFHPATPCKYTEYEQTQHPLLTFHLTYFPASANNGQAYTAIGFARPHGVFDGTAASFIMRAIIAELKGEEWTAPPLPSEGLNVNPIVRAIEQLSLSDPKAARDADEYMGYSVLGVSGIIKLVAEQIWQKFWHGADRRITLLPKGAFRYIVDNAKDALRKEGKDDAQISSSDILVAWLYKTLYASGTPPESKIHVTNFASVRTILAKSSTPPDPSIISYPHNAFIPLPYPVLSVSEVLSIPLHDLAAIMASSRHALSEGHISAAFKTLSSPTTYMPGHLEAEDSLTISNVSSTRILESDWSIIGAQRTVCGYRYQVNPTRVVFTNAVFIAGRLDDGSVVLDSVLSKARVALLDKEVEKLISQASK